MSENSIVDLSGLTEPVANVATKLMDKLSNGVGWIANKKTPKKIAIDTYIEEIKNSNLEPIVKAALISNAQKTIKEYCNQNNIIEIARNSLNSNAHPECIDDDWLNQFMDKARMVSDEEFQFIWGKILAEECNVTNSIPKQLLSILEQMDKSDAEAFTAICSITVYFEFGNEISFYPIINSSNVDELCSKIGINDGDLVNLNALGLIEINFSVSNDFYGFKLCKTPVVLKYHNHELELPKGMDELSTGNVILTKAGSALCNAININEELEGFWEEYCLPTFQKAIKEFNDQKSDGSNK